MKRSFAGMPHHAAGYFFFFAILGTFGPHGSWFLEQHYGYDESESGLLLMLVHLTGVSAALALAFLADRFRMRTALQRGLAFGAFAAALAWWGAGLWPLALAVAVLQGLTVNPHVSLLDAATLEGLGARRHRFSRVRIAGTVGFGVATFGVASLADGFGPTVVPIALGTAACGFALAMLRVPDTQAAAPKAPSDPASLAASAATPPRSPFSPPLVLLLVATFLHTLAYGHYEAFAALHLRGAGLQGLQVGTVLCAGLAAEVGIFLIAPRLLTRFSAASLAAFAMLASALRWAILPELRGFVPLALQQLVHALGFALWYAACMWLLGRLARPERATLLQAAFSTATALGMGLGASLGGYGRELLGVALTFRLDAAIGLCAAALLWFGRGLLNSPGPESPNVR